MPFVGQRLQRFGEQRPVLHLHRQFAAIRATEGAFHAQPIAAVHQRGDLFKPTFLLGFQPCLLQKQLDRAGFVGKGEKSELAHHPTGHHPTRHGDGDIPFFPIGEIAMGVLQRRHAMAGLKTKGIGPLP